jgi:chaperonin cofactor prefoldin
MTDTQLATGAAEQAIHNRFTEALRGAQAQLVNGLEPAFIQLYQTITTVTVNGSGFFEGLGHVIANVVGFIAGAIAGLTGAKVEFGSLGQDAGAAFDGLGQGAQNAAGGIDGTGSSAQRAGDALKALKEATREQTDALTNQVDALNAQKQAYDDQIQAQKDALQDQLDSVTSVNDDRRRQGEDVISYERRLEEDGLKSKIGALDKQKTAKDRAYDEEIKALELQKQKLQQHLSDEESMVGDATGAMGSDFAGIGPVANNMAETVKTAMQGIDTKAFSVGQDVGAIWRGLFSDPQGTMGREAKFLADTVGVDFGKHLVQGVEDGIAAQAAGPFQWLWGQLVRGITQSGTSDWTPLAPPATPGNGTLGSYALGTITTRDQFAYIHKNEAVLPLDHPARAAQLMRQAGLAGLAGDGGLVQNITFTGPVADEYVASKVNARLAREQSRKVLSLRGGIG